MRARSEISSALAQLDDYVLPRVRSLDAPLLAVVGGSTGAGKSTLVNAIAGHPVTQTGAIRPTTRVPVLLHHPDDSRWFEDRRVLPNLNRVTAAAGGRAHPEGVSSLLMVPDAALPAGLALLDAPDVDSVAEHNRMLASQLLAAADLWVFVTTANRYADAVPWKVLRNAAARDILVSVVLDRVPRGADVEVTEDLRSMLENEGLGTAPLFVLPETTLGPDGMLPEELVRPLRQWLAHLAQDSAKRAEVASQTLNGAIRSLADSVKAAARAAVAQEEAGVRLAADVEEAYAEAVRRIMESTKDGALLRGEVLARWQDFVGTGEFFRSVEQNIGRIRDRIGAFLRGQPSPAERVEGAIESGLHAVIVNEAARAAEEAEQRWRADPAGRQLLASKAGVHVDDFPARAAAEIRDWQRALLSLIQSEGADRRVRARLLSFGVNGAAVLLMMVVFSMTGGLTGLEVGIAGGSAVIGQKLLEAIFGDEAVRRLARLAREDLAVRCEALLQSEARGFRKVLDEFPIAESAGALMDHAQSLSRLGGSA